jgi:hypothetical protein
MHSPCRAASGEGRHQVCVRACGPGLRDRRKRRTSAGERRVLHRRAAGARSVRHYTAASRAAAPDHNVEATLRLRAVRRRRCPTASRTRCTAARSARRSFSVDDKYTVNDTAPHPARTDPPIHTLPIRPPGPRNQPRRRVMRARARRLHAARTLRPVLARSAPQRTSETPRQSTERPRSATARRRPPARRPAGRTDLLAARIRGAAPKEEPDG